MMRLNIKSTAMIFACLIMGCKDKNVAHTHGSDSHTHEAASNVLSSENYFGAYNLKDDEYGTKTQVTITDKQRIMFTNSLPNHSTGEFPNTGNPNTISAQNRTFKFPLKPKYTGKAKWIREPGIALNGIKFEPGTAEVVVCESGENYRVEAFQDIIDLGLDFNNAHVQPTGAYHYHGSPSGVIENFDSGEDLVHIGFAHDGFPMYYSKSNAYKPSFKLADGTRAGEDCTYTNPGQTIDVSVGGHHDGSFGSDFTFIDGSGDLDECNGITIDGQYMYLVTNEFPYVSRCLMGEFESQERGGPPQGSGRGEPGQKGERPNAKQLFEKMDTNTDGKITTEESEGPLKQKFTEVDSNNDGYVSQEELEKDLADNKGPGRRP